MKNSIIRSWFTAGVAEIGSDLKLEALAGLLQRFDELQRVRRVDVVVGGAVVEEQPARKIGLRR